MAFPEACGEPGFGWQPFAGVVAQPDRHKVRHEDARFDMSEESLLWGVGRQAKRPELPKYRRY